MTGSQLAESSLVKTLKTLDLKLVNVESDGNCLYRAISFQILEAEIHHQHYRELAVQHMITHRNDYEHFFADVDGGFDAYMIDMSKRR